MVDVVLGTGAVMVVLVVLVVVAVVIVFVFAVVDMAVVDAVVGVVVVFVVVEKRFVDDATELGFVLYEVLCIILVDSIVESSVVIEFKR